MSKVLITGGSGLVGSYLTTMLRDKGHDVSHLSRKRSGINIPGQYLWNIDKGLLEDAALTDVDIIVHLAGANISAGRWTPSRKREIVNSRVDSSRLLFDHISRMSRKPVAFITSSATGYYGALSSERIFDEDSKPAANDFLSRTCRVWEESAAPFTGIGVRKVVLRSGMVLSPKEGALQKLRIPVRLGLASALGKGTQYIPWIHLEDLCRIYIRAIEDTKMSGPYNAVAPDHVTNKDFTRIIARVMEKPFWFPRIPAILLRIFLGSMSEMLLYGSRISSKRIIETGFEFCFPKIEPALKDCLGKQKVPLHPLFN